MKFRSLLAFGLGLVVSLSETHAGELSRVEHAETYDRFAAGSWELENVVGSYFLFDRGGNHRISTDYAVDSVRLGLMVSNPKASGLLRGNFEFMGEAFGGHIFQGPGSVLGGITFFFRYNFIHPNAHIIPYVQVGGGGVYTDVAHGLASSDDIGADFEFNLQGIIGLRFLLNSHWSINTEGSYRHISNAGLATPNYGIDSAGGALGFGYAF